MCVCRQDVMHRQVNGSEMLFTSLHIPLFYIWILIPPPSLCVTVATASHIQMDVSHLALMERLLAIFTHMYMYKIAYTANTEATVYSWESAITKCAFELCLQASTCQQRTTFSHSAPVSLLTSHRGQDRKKTETNLRLNQLCLGTKCEKCLVHASAHLSHTSSLFPLFFCLLFFPNTGTN